MNKQLFFIFLAFYSNVIISSDGQNSLVHIPDSELNQFKELICFGCQIENPMYGTLSQEFVVEYPQAIQDLVSEELKIGKSPQEDYQRIIVLVTSSRGILRYRVKNKTELHEFTRMLGRISPQGRHIQALDFYYVTQYAQHSAENRDEPNVIVQDGVSLQYLREQAARKNV